MYDHIRRMARPSNRDKLLTEGLQVIHQHGFAGSSVRDIAQAAGVPQGSFTNHFASKEAFGLEIIELYVARGCEVARDTLENEALRPLDRLRAYFDAQLGFLQRSGMRNGCLIGNFGAEASDHSELIRARVVEAFAARQGSIARCLQAAVAAGELPRTLDPEEVAAFLYASFQGAMLVAKAQRSPAPIERFVRHVFSTVLAPGAST
jgi:TetR/AcrR family transcriptional repressor of nem operon